MSGTTTENEKALERRNWNKLAAAVAVGILCMLGIVIVQQVRWFINAIARGHTDEA